MTKIYAILATFNPSDIELETAITQLKSEVSIIVICNNSDHYIDTSEQHVKVLNFGENLGVAEAQSRGMAWAFNNGCDFILQVDQDSTIKKGTVKALCSSHQTLTSKGFNVGIIGPRHHDTATSETEKKPPIKGRAIASTNCAIVDVIISSCSLISRQAYKAAGPMDCGLFIDAVDFEYCWRLKNLGFVTVKDYDILFSHRIGQGKIRILAGIKVRVSAPIRHYYRTRNLFLLLPRNYVPLFWKLANLVKVGLNVTILPFIFDQGFTRFVYTLKGIRDGICGRTGRINKK